MADERREILDRMMRRRDEIARLQRDQEQDENELAQLQDMTPAHRSIEEHIEALKPREGFDLADLTDHDRHAIARVVVDAWIFGMAWITREEGTGLMRQDPLRVEIRDRRMT